jgi:phytol kinase
MVQYYCTRPRRAEHTHRLMKGQTLTRRDILGLILSYLYAFGLLFAAEAAGKKLRWPHYVTRKLVHIGAGMWIWGVIGLFDTWTIGIIPFGTFIVLNFVFYRTRLFRAMDAADASPGTVYFALSITVLFAALWRDRGPVDRVPIAAAAVMAMTWGDGLASIVGQSAGRHAYTTFGHARTWEGTAAMGLASFAAMSATLLALSASASSPFSAPVSPGPGILAAAVGASVAAAVEALSPAGTDNLAVPLLTACALYLMLG